jgi:hypothetical protein
LAAVRVQAAGKGLKRSTVFEFFGIQSGRGSHDNQFQFRFSKPAQMPPVDAIFMASSMCKGMTTKTVWSYALVELNGTTKVTEIERVAFT